MFQLAQSLANPPTLPNHPTCDSVTPTLSNPTSPTTNAALAYNIASEQQTAAVRHPRAAPRKPVNASTAQVGSLYGLEFPSFLVFHR